MKLIIKSSVNESEADTIEVEVGNTLNLIKLIITGFFNASDKNHGNEYRALLGMNEKGDMIITNYDDYIE